MSTYLSEEEQVEAIKKWWRDNGKSLIAGAVIGLGGVFGWQSWTQHNANQAEQASVLFEQLHQTVRNADAVDSAAKQAQILRDEHGDSIYAAFALLDLAKLKAEGGDVAGALEDLQWVAENGNEEAVRQLAKLRKARLMLDQGDTAGVKGLLSQISGSAYGGEVAAIRGDLARSQGDLEAARQAYSEALAAQPGNPSLIRMKLDELGGAPDTGETS